MLRTRLAASVLAALTLALPAAAVADNAGDNQYKDPFSGSQTPSKKKPAATTTPAPAPTPTPSQAPTPTATTAAPPASGTSSGELPRTGFPLLQVAGAGVLLVGAGVLLLRRRAA
jgi:LPXTG-motif cell wall-anchored protein